MAVTVQIPLITGFCGASGKGRRGGSCVESINKLWGSGLQDEKAGLMLGTVADVKKTIYYPCPYG